VSDAEARFEALFLEVYEALPRQGPGNRACAARALALCRELPPSPSIADLGCGAGAQTLHLAELTTGSIVALDRHAPFIERLRAIVAQRGLAPRVRAIVADMAQPPLPPASFDLVWSEGALYSIGLRRALLVCRDLLRPGGCLAFTDAIWRRDHPPAAVKATFDLDYPAMGRVDDVLAAIDDSGLDLVGHFTVDDQAWWDDFYTPMQTRIAQLRGKYAGDTQAAAILDRLAGEPQLHRRYSDFYAYEFFVARRPCA
jgi:SAM-dependent methyltransferase